MIELTSILVQFFVFLIICSFPLNPKNLNKFIKSNGNSLNYIDCHAINIIILLNILLVASFFDINLRFIFLFLFTISLIFIIFRRKEIFLLINKKNITKFSLFFIICISIFISTAQTLKLEWDGLHWILKALVFFNDTSIQNLKYLILPEYPHLGGYIWAFFWKNSILELEYFGRLFYIYFYLISILTIFNLLKFKSEKLTFILIFSIIFITYDPYLFAGYQEYLIFSTLLISARFITLINFEKKNEYRKIFLILLIMSLLMWFKDEGLFYFLIFGILLVILNKSPLKTKGSLILIILTIICIHYLLQKNIIGIYGFQSELINKEILDKLFNFKLLVLETIAITKHLIIAFMKYPLLIIIIFSFLVTNIFYRKKNIFIKYFFYAFVLNIFFIYAVYLYSSSSELFLSVTLDRLMFQTSGFYLLMIIFLLNKSKFQNSNF